jgi:hypothetical protein
MFDKGQYGKTDVQVHDGKLFSIVWIREDTVLTTAAQGIVVSKNNIELVPSS